MVLQGMAGTQRAEHNKNGCKNPSPLHLDPGQTLLPLHSLQPSVKQQCVKCYQSTWKMGTGRTSW